MKVIIISPFSLRLRKELFEFDTLMLANSVSRLLILTQLFFSGFSIILSLVARKCVNISDIFSCIKNSQVVRWYFMQVDQKFNKVFDEKLLRTDVILDPILRN
jgi:hypothetical protein